MVFPAEFDIAGEMNHEVSIPSRGLWFFPNNDVLIEVDGKVSIPSRGLWFFPRLCFKGLRYLVFKVQLRYSIAKVSFQPPTCQEAKNSISLKTNHSKHYSIWGNRFFCLSTSNQYCASNTAEKLNPSKKTPTDSPKFSDVAIAFLKPNDSKLLLQNSDC